MRKEGSLADRVDKLAGIRGFKETILLRLVKLLLPMVGSRLIVSVTALEVEDVRAASSQSVYCLVENGDRYKTCYT